MIERTDERDGRREVRGRDTGREIEITRTKTDRQYLTERETGRHTDTQTDTYRHIQTHTDTCGQRGNTRAQRDRDRQIDKQSRGSGERIDSEKRPPAEMYCLRQT